MYNFLFVFHSIKKARGEHLVSQKKALRLQINDVNKQQYSPKGIVVFFLFSFFSFISQLKLSFFLFSLLSFF